MRYRLGLVLLLCQVTGCATWHGTGREPRLWLLQKPAKLVRVSTRNGAVFFIADPVALPDSLVGDLRKVVRAPATPRASVPWTDIYTMEYRSFDPGKTVLLALGGVIVWTFVLCHCVTETHPQI